MTFEEMVVALVATLGGLALVGFIIAKISGLLKAWINRNKGGVPEEAFDRLAKAFVEHKKDTQRRLQNLEAIIADEGQNMSTEDPQQKQVEPATQTIEIEDPEPEENPPTSSTGNLRNMLRE